MFSKKKTVKVLDIGGVISASKKATGYNHYKFLEELYNIKKDDKISGAILRINSPGGSAGASSELAREIENLNSEKPTLISISDMCCSGGYMAAVAGKEIWASPMALVGSIGVIIQAPDLQKLSEKIGFKMRVIKSSEMKDIGSPFRDMTQREKEIFQELINEGYEDFFEYVIGKRPQILGENVDETEAKNKIKETIATGAIFTANQALKNHLIDKIGTYFDVTNRMAEILEIKREKLKLEYVKHGSFLSRHLNGLTANVVESLENYFFCMK